MFINIKISSKNQNSLKNFLTFFNSFCLKKSKKKNLYTIKKKLTKIIKKKWSNKSKIFLPSLPNFKIYNHKKICKYKINKKKYIIKKKANGLLSYSQQKQKRKVFTTLKSPHVNKTAQEQIEYRLFSKHINIFSFQILKFLILIKKIQMKLCPDIEIQIKFVLNNKIIKKTKLVSLNPDNYKTNSFSSYKKKDIGSIKKVQKLNKKQILSYLQLFDIYGELSFKNYVWIAQLVEQRTENPCVGSSSLSLNKLKKIMKHYFYNMIANIKNGQTARKSFILQKQKKICNSFLNILWDEGYILGYKTQKNNSNTIKIFLKYNQGKPVINSLKLISKPGHRIYYSAKQIWKINSNRTFIIFTTNKGLLTTTDCKKLKIGGEPLVSIN